MEIIMTRKSGNKEVTKGILTVPSTDFTACTLEAKDPNYSACRNKALLAVPDGIYRLKLFYGQTGYSMRFMLGGTYNRARFESGHEPYDVAPGSIILGNEFDGDFAIKGNECAMQVFSRFLEMMASQQRLANHNDEAILTIQHAPDYKYDRTVRSVQETFAADYSGWNLLKK